jgi:hypothetical protein
MCCSRANRACSDFTRASVEIRSSLRYSSFGEVPIFRCSSVTASENADVAASYSVASRVFSSQGMALLFQLFWPESWRGGLYQQRKIIALCMGHFEQTFSLVQLWRQPQVATAPAGLDISRI